MKRLDLARTGLVLAPRQVRRTRWRTGLYCVLAFAAGAGAGEAWHLLAPHLLPPPASTAAGPPPLQAQLDQARQALRLSEARGRELEHQIDTLHQQRQALEDELAFFRKSAAKH